MMEQTPASTTSRATSPPRADPRAAPDDPLSSAEEVSAVLEATITATRGEHANGSGLPVGIPAGPMSAAPIPGVIMPVTGPRAGMHPNGHGGNATDTALSGGRSTPNPATPGGRSTGAHGPVAPNLTKDRDRIAADLGDGLVHQMFAISLDLHAALSLIDRSPAAEKIAHAISGLDQAINDLRMTIFDMHPRESAPPYLPRHRRVSRAS